MTHAYHWPHVEIGELVRIGSGQVSPLDPDYSELPHIGPENLRAGGGIINSGIRTARDLGLVSGKYVFDETSILYSKIRPALNKVGLPEFSGICSADMYPMWVRDPNTTDREFVYHALTSEAFVDSAAGRSFRTGIPKINREDLDSLTIPVPPILEQRKITEILRTWDEAIDGNSRALALRRDLREQLRDGLFMRALEQDGHWTTFGEILSESRMPGTHGGVARKLTIKLYGKGAVPKSSTVTGSSGTKYFARKAGQLVYSKLDFLNGAFAIVPGDLDGYETTLDLPAFDVSPSVNPVWLLEYLLRPRYYQSQVHLARGQRKARRVSPEVFLAEPLWLPERDSQDELADVLIAATAEIDLSERKGVALRAQKRGLMQKLLTGQLRVNVAAETEPGGPTDD